MPAILANANNLLLTTDYPIDQLIFLKEGSVTVPDATDDITPGISIPHGIPFAPLPLLSWSNTSDFAITNTVFDAALSSTIFTTGVGQQYDVSANGTNVLIDRYNRSGSSKTLYYRIIAFATSNADENSEIAETATYDNEFILSTDYNYMKLMFTGKLTTGLNSFTHGLGYTPRVFAWQKTGSSYSPLIAAQLIDIDPTGSVGATSGLYVNDTVIKWLNPNTYSEIEYRIYAEA